MMEVMSNSKRNVYNRKDCRIDNSERIVFTRQDLKKEIVELFKYTRSLRMHFHKYVYIRWKNSHIYARNVNASNYILVSDQDQLITLIISNKILYIS